MMMMMPHTPRQPIRLLEHPDPDSNARSLLAAPALSPPRGGRRLLVPLPLLLLTPSPPQLDEHVARARQARARPTGALTLLEQLLDRVGSRHQTPAAAANNRTRPSRFELVFLLLLLSLSLTVSQTITTLAPIPAPVDLLKGRRRNSRSSRCSRRGPH
jgi:hypothetical protein